MKSLNNLYALADSYGIQHTYDDVFGHKQTSQPEAIIDVLRALGAPIMNINDAAHALFDKRRTDMLQPIEPVIVYSGDARLPAIKLRIPKSVCDETIHANFLFESGESKELDYHARHVKAVKSFEFDGIAICEKHLKMPSLQHGYTWLTLDISGKVFEALIIHAPEKAFSLTEKCAWGINTALYSLRSENNWGAGDFSDLRKLMLFVGKLGGNAVSTLPLLAMFLDDMFDPSPYKPVSRLFWNEFYLDVTSIPEFQDCSRARNIFESMQGRIRNFRQSNLVDYRSIMSVKRIILDELCHHFYAHPNKRFEAFQEWSETNPGVESYSCFRAACEKLKVPWRQWPDHLKNGSLDKDTYDEAERRFHLYVQWLSTIQIGNLASAALDRGVSLCFDLPLGTHPDGYDTWKDKENFASGVSIGAPPDAFFASGQNWGFPPLQREKGRQKHYSHFIRYLRHSLVNARIIRIDHVMGFHRLFFIPDGYGAKEGVYVKYPADEYYAILSLESNRFKTSIICEDLGTVPLEVKKALQKHGLSRMYVASLELQQRPEIITQVMPLSAAFLETYDLYPFAGFLGEKDIDMYCRLGIYDKDKAESERRKRNEIRKTLARFAKSRNSNHLLDIIKAYLLFIADSPARFQLINFEDLWLETEPQNIPGTTDEYPNWQKKQRYNLESIIGFPDVVELLKEIDRKRKSIKKC